MNKPFRGLMIKATKMMEKPGGFTEEGETRFLRKVDF